MFYEAARPDEPIEVAPVTVPRLVSDPPSPTADVATSPLRTLAKMNLPSRATRYEEIAPLAALV